MAERKYALMKITNGHYVLPSNDRRTLYGLSRYFEDGSLTEPDGTPVRGMFWMLTRTRVIGEDGMPDPSEWETCEVLLPTRAEAIKSAERMMTE